MTTSNKDKEKGMKPGANMPAGGYDPAREGMSESGNHATGNAANDAVGNQQSGRQPARSEATLRQDNQSRTDLHNKQSASAAATEATHRDRNAGARGDDSTHTSNKSGSDS
ncbi:hypothetical protein [Duganella aceris]|jgi:hypothetical protein|uniref:Stress-induced protein n=1 Tax=Duganella aceris TaxID=2703883 RepID=A0ABX0FSN4_9BURK|nr:hypothetical protein [Duganella aceris]NGZ87349.1 hypothetical protein [Duganella aceris]